MSKPTFKITRSIRSQQVLNTFMERVLKNLPFDRPVVQTKTSLLIHPEKLFNWQRDKTIKRDRGSTSIFNSLAICIMNRWNFSDAHHRQQSQCQFFPQEIDALLQYNNFLIEHKSGNYREEEFSSDVWKQLIICRAK
jgi:hypothetical protein